MSPEDLKKLSAIKARFNELASTNAIAITKGEWLKMVWSGIIPEVQWLIEELEGFVGEIGPPNDASPLPVNKPSVKKVKTGRTRLSKVAANREFQISNDEGDL